MIINPILTYEETQWTERESHLFAQNLPRFTLSGETEGGEKKKEERKKSFQDFLETRLRNVGNDVRNYTGQHKRDRIVTVGASLKRREGALGVADHEAELVLHSFWWLKFWQNSTVSLVT